MTKNCENCGGFCRKEPSIRYDLVWKCDECNLRFPKGGPRGSPNTTPGPVSSGGGPEEWGPGKDL